MSKTIFSIGFITADEYLRVRVLEGFFKSMGAIPAFLGQGIEKSLRLPKEVLKSGGSVGIFLEGRVIGESRLGAAKIGVAVLAIETRAPILPVAVKRNGRFAFEILVGESSTFTKRPPPFHVWTPVKPSRTPQRG